MSIHEQRLLQAIQNYSTGSKGGELPKGIEEALAGLTKVLSSPAPGKDSPGAREALKVAPGTTGTGESIKKAALGIDGPSPGQREAQSLSQQIADAAAQLTQK